ncbi:MAG: hypothetical protein CSA36_05060 [Draconibacterium sp.]|nr:MAG: hypothetical protein CSA36_05060 [Draconibacterium sp.]
MSNIQLNGTHTPTKRGGEAVAYQGIPLTCSDAVKGNHNDSFNLVPTVQKIIAGLAFSKIRIDGLFLNADAEFDTEEFRGFVF